MKIALVHDYLVQNGGAERVLECFTDIFPDAPIYTLLHDKQAMGGSFSDKLVYTSFMQKIPLARRRHRFFPILMPLAIEQFDFSQYDIVLSDSSSYAKGIITRPETLHICYMHTPMRYAWDDCQKYTQEFSFPGFIKKAVPYAMNYLRLWDKVSADRVDKIIANSNFVRKRIKKYYHKDSIVINPPVQVNRFYSGKKGDYYLMTGRLLAYKRFDIAIEAFNQLGLPLKIIGVGPELERLKRMAKFNIEFLGRVSDDDLPKYYADCRAFIFPQEEDFGIVAIEAMAAGKPLVAYRGGDIPEHMEEGKGGFFFHKQTAEDIIGATCKLEKTQFDAIYIKNKAQVFAEEFFKEKIRLYVEREFAKHKKELVFKN